MGKFWVSMTNFDNTWKMGIFDGSSSFSREFWRQNVNGGWATLIAILFILICHFTKKFFFSANRHRSSLAAASDSTPPVSSSASSQSGIPEIVSDADLKFLIENLDEKFNGNEKWENVIDRRNNLLSYNAKCCKSKNCPLKYLSVTIFENCSPEMLMAFYMDNDYRKQWDKTLVDHEQLQVDRMTGVELGRTIKKFPLLTPREYVLAWRLWEGIDKTFYCFIKECEHPLAPQQKKYVRVRYFRSGWRIRKVPGRNASEIKMFHQEDAGLNVEMAKLAFAKGIWSYVCKMDTALHKYSATSHPQTSPAVTAVTLIQQVPHALDAPDNTSISATPAETDGCELLTCEAKEKKLSRRPSRKLVAKSLLLLGGVICLSRGHSSLGAKVAMAYILSKLRKRGTPSSQGKQS